MDSNTVPADVRWAIANWPESAERGEVSRFCQRQGISRSVFYKIRRQAREQGPVGARRAGVTTAAEEPAARRSEGDRARAGGAGMAR